MQPSHRCTRRDAGRRHACPALPQGRPRTQAARPPGQACAGLGASRGGILARLAQVSARQQTQACTAAPAQACRTGLKKLAGGSSFDVVVHDGAPNIGGAWTQEAYSQVCIVARAHTHTHTCACECERACLHECSAYCMRVHASLSAHACTGVRTHAPSRPSVHALLGVLLVCLFVLLGVLLVIGNW